MFLLLAGSSEMARALIVDEFLTHHDDWRHLALEDLADMESEEEIDDILGFQEMFMTMVACQCAMEAQAAGHHVVITVPESEMIASVYDEIDEKIVSVYLGAADEADGFDHVIDGTTHSMNEICEELNSIIEVTPA